MPHIHWIIIFCLSIFRVTGQVSTFHVNDHVNIQELVKSLQGPGTVITNVTYSIPPIIPNTDPPKPIGYFEDTEGLLGCNKGLLMTTGSAVISIGPNNESQASMELSPDEWIDDDLKAVLNEENPPLYDAVVIEFDITPSFNRLSFSYLFGSDEYTEFVGFYNDVFGFFISGPGITGTKNLAVLENGDPVSINSINNYINTEYFISNGEGDTPVINPYLQYDGFTKKLIARADVIPGETYHIKLAIADYGDSSVDSGVFIEKESFESADTYTVSIAYENEAFEYAIEGCNQAVIKIEREEAESIWPLQLNINISGSAVNGVDVDNIPSGTFELAVGETAKTIIVNPISDNLSEQDETLTFTFTNVATNKSEIVDVPIHDTFKYLLDDETVCANNATTINQNHTPDYSFQWDDPDGVLSCVDCASPKITTEKDRTVAVSVTHITSGCQTLSTKTVKASVFEYPFQEQLVCRNTSTQINKNASDDFSFVWKASNTLSCLECSSPYITIEEPTVLEVEVKDLDSGCTTISEATIGIQQFDYLLPEQSVCKNIPTKINESASPNDYIFRWSTNPALSCTECVSPSLTIDKPTELEVEIRDQKSGCTTVSKATYRIHEFDYRLPEFSVCQNTPTKINQEASPARHTFRWPVNSALTCSECTSPEVLLTDDKERTFEVEIEENSSGCKVLSKAVVHVNKVGYTIPDFTICKETETAINTNAPTHFEFDWQEHKALDCQQCVAPKVKLSQEDAFQVNVKNLLNRCTNRQVVNVSVNSVKYSINESTICANTPTHINVNAPDKFSFLWQADNALSCLNCPSPSALLSTDRTFSVLIHDQFTGCKQMQTMPVKVHHVSYPEQEKLVCQNTPTPIHDNPQPGFLFSWERDSDLSCVRCVSPTVILSSNKQFVLNVTEIKSGCVTPVNVSAVVKEIAANFTFSLIDSITHIGIDLQNLSTGATHYRWNLDDDISEQAEPWFTIAPSGQSLQVTLTAINRDSVYCESTITHTISLREGLFVPNVITPNSDHYNDAFAITGIEKGVWQLNVINSWGTTVFRSNAYDNDWDGDQVGAGIYFYELRHPRFKIAYKGWVHVLK